MAPAADEMMGTAARGVKLVMLQTRSPNRTLAMHMVLRIDQLSSKKTAFASAAVIAIVDRWTAAGGCCRTG